MYVGIGSSKNHQDSFSAGREAASQAIEKGGQGKADALIVLCSTVFDNEKMLAGIREVSQAPLIGCTTAGAIMDEGPIEQALGILALVSDTVIFHPVKVEHISQGIREAGKEFAKAVSGIEGEKAKFAFLFSDALSGNGTELVRGVLELMGNGFPLVGGAAGDDMNFKKTYQYYNGEVLTDAAVGLAVSGKVRYAIGADHGWQPIGNARVVTKAKGTTLYELDGKPAFSIYKDYFGERASDFKKALSLAAVSYPLGMETKGTDQFRNAVEKQACLFMIRAPLSIQEDGSIVCGAEVIEGSRIFLMIGTQSSALWAARETVRRLVEEVPGIKPRLVFLSDCIARKILYGERSKEEIEAIKEAAGSDAHVFGFYSYGQIAPLAVAPLDVNTCDPGFYEQSISVAVFGE